MTIGRAVSFLTRCISTHTLTWSVTAYLRKSLSIRAYFNSHAHVERDLLPLLPRCLSFHFNSHAHVERDYSGFATGTNYQDFNSHAHVERDYLMMNMKPNSANFNSHAHVERDSCGFYIKYTLNISTHTLTWSVTKLCQKIYKICLFQLTRSRGA